MATIQAVPLDDPTATTLWAEQQRELFERYGEPDEDAHFYLDMPPDALITSLLAVTEEGEPVATGLLRWSPFDTGAGSAEVKRLYVRAGARGRGHARDIMAAIEDAAARAGATRIVLETGTEQPEALGLYASLGYDRITPYGEYKDHEQSICFGRELPTRVIVINGSIGAGKTKTAAAVFDTLAERGSRSAQIDGDFLAEAHPAPDGDRFRQALMFANLAAVAPVYRASGYGIMVIARVVEDPEDRSRYATAFASDAGPAEVRIVRVTAPEDERKARILVRDLEPEWQQWGHARTVELHEALERLQLDDAVVTNSGRLPMATAAEILERLGW
ncbi:GNAT family N-acetyltransferase [Demequina sp.]|uniref:GNAT family N-acetyltransferase n=1 Tax=Demequina sp. TaxID=2050685 RepID=UPI003D0AC921